MYLSIYLSSYLQVWQRGYSARLPNFLNLTTSKMQQFCETSSTFEVDNVKHEAILRDFLNFQVDNIKNEAILQDFLPKWKVECRADGLVPLRFAIFPLHLSKVLRLPRKKWYQVIRSAAPVTQNHLSKPEALWGNQRPDLLTSLMNMSLVLCPPREMHLCRSSANVPRLPSFLEMPQNSHVLLTFGKVQNPLRLPRKTTSEPSKVVRASGVFNILTWKRASRHNGVHFFDISTSKSGPTLEVFAHFDFEMCFALQRRALFQHLNFQKKRTLTLVCFVRFDFEMCFATQRRSLSRHLNFQKWSQHDVFCTF